MREHLQNHWEQGEKITQTVESGDTVVNSIGREKSKTAIELAYAEVISCNKKDLERELQNESRQNNKRQGRAKQREKEF